MPRLFIAMAPVLACCNPMPQKAAVPVPDSRTSAEGPQTPATATRRPDQTETARGRRILSTAFVMMGPDGHMTVELQDGNMLELRNLVMRPDDYCGNLVATTASSTRYCGQYADVTAARPGGRATLDQLDLNAPAPVEAARGVPHGK